MPTTTTEKGIQHGYAVDEDGWTDSMNQNLRLTDAGLDMRWAYDPETTSGLSFAYFGGPIVSASGAVSVGSAGQVVLADDDVSYVERTHAGVVSSNTSGFTTGALPMYQVTTASGAITDVLDRRVPSTQVPTGLPPSGTAGGVLAGTYPNPSFAADMATQAELDAAVAALKDGVSASFDTLAEVATELGSLDTRVTALESSGPGSGSSGSPAYEIARVADIGLTGSNDFESSIGSLTERGANTGSMSETIKYGRLIVSPPVNTASANLHLLDIAAPATPYAVEIGAVITSMQANVCLFGPAVIATNGALASQKVMYLAAFGSGSTSGRLQVQYYTSNTTRSGVTPGTAAGFTDPARRIILRVTNDGTTLKFEFRFNDGIDWTTFHSEANTSHFGGDTIDRIGIAFESFTTAAWSVDLEYFLVYTP